METLRMCFHESGSDLVPVTFRDGDGQDIGVAVLGSVGVETGSEDVNCYRMLRGISWSRIGI